jgi:hypothetical protein
MLSKIRVGSLVTVRVPFGQRVDWYMRKIIPNSKDVTGTVVALPEGGGWTIERPGKAWLDWTVDCARQPLRVRTHRFLPPHSSIVPALPAAPCNCSAVSRISPTAAHVLSKTFMQASVAPIFSCRA